MSPTSFCVLHTEKMFYIYSSRVLVSYRNTVTLEFSANSYSYITRHTSIPSNISLSLYLPLNVHFFHSLRLSFPIFSYVALSSTSLFFFVSFILNSCPYSPVIPSYHLYSEYRTSSLYSNGILFSCGLGSISMKSEMWK